MTNADAFFESFVNVPHVVLGRRLQPLCINHLLWLYHIGSPLILTSKDVTLEDLEVAVAVCSSKSNEEVFARLQVKELTPWKRIRNFLWHRANRTRRDFRDELRRFIAYNDDFVALPRFLPNDSESNEVLPWLLLHATSLIKATGWSEDVVFSLPIGKVIWFNLSFGYLNTGESRVMSDKEQAAAEAITSLYGGLTGKGK